VHRRAVCDPEESSDGETEGEGGDSAHCCSLRRPSGIGLLP